MNPGQATFLRQQIHLKVEDIFLVLSQNDSYDGCGPAPTHPFIYFLDRKITSADIARNNSCCKWHVQSSLYNQRRWSWVMTMIQRNILTELASLFESKVHKLLFQRNQRKQSISILKQSTCLILRMSSCLTKGQEKNCNMAGVSGRKSQDHMIPAKLINCSCPYNTRIESTNGQR